MLVYLLLTKFANSQESEDPDQASNDDDPDLDMSSPQGYKTFAMLNSAEHEIFPAHKC